MSDPNYTIKEEKRISPEGAEFTLVTKVRAAGEPSYMTGFLVGRTYFELIYLDAHNARKFRHRWDRKVLITTKTPTVAFDSSIVDKALRSLLFGGLCEDGILRIET